MEPLRPQASFAELLDACVQRVTAVHVDGERAPRDPRRMTAYLEQVARVGGTVTLFGPAAQR